MKKKIPKYIGIKKSRRYEIIKQIYKIFISVEAFIVNCEALELF